MEEVSARPSQSRLDNNSFRIALLAVLYFATGKLGLALAVPPGYATMIWPPSGIALGFALIYGNRIWPGIFIGSLVLNAHIGGLFSQNLDDLFKHIFVPAGIAFGSTIQALLGAWLAGIYLKKIKSTIGIRDVLFLFIVCGPLVCLVAPTIGTSLLLSQGKILSVDFWGNWESWWIGDVFGILVFTPLILLAPFGNKNKFKIGDVFIGNLSFLSVLLIILPLGLSFYIWKVTYEEAYNQAYLNFQSLTRDSETALSNRIRSYSHALTVGNAYYTNIPNMTREKWNSYVSSIPLKQNYPGIRGIGVIYDVPTSDLNKFQDAAQKEGPDFFQIHPTGVKEENYIIRYIYPEEPNAKAIGLNIAFEKNRRTAAEISRNSGLPAITNKIVLVQDATESAGFLLFYPIFDPEEDRKELSEQKPSTKGWIYAPFIANDFLADLSEGQGRSFNISIYDGTEKIKNNLIYSSVKQSDTAHKPAYHYEKTMDVMQQKWLITWDSTADFESANSNSQPFVILMWGLSFTFIFSALLLLYSISQKKSTEDKLGRGGIIVPLAVFSIMFSGAAYLYKVMNEKEKEFINSILVEESENSISAIEIGVQYLAHAIDRMADRTLYNKGDADGKLYWQTDANNYLKDFGSVEKLAWLNNDFDLIDVKSSQEAGVNNIPTFKKILDEFKETILKSGGKKIFISKPVTLMGESPGILIFSAIKDKKLSKGYMVSYISLKKFLSKRTSEKSNEDSCILISHENQMVFASEYAEEAKYRISSKDITVKKPFNIGESKFDIEVFHCLKSGANSNAGLFSISFLIYGTIISLLMGALARYVFTSRMKSEHLRKAMHEAEQANKAKSLFLQNISHEIRTPLNGILATTELLEKTKLTELQKKYIDLVYNSGHILFNLLSDVLDLSKIESHKFEIRIAPFNLSKVVALSVELFASSAKQKGLSLECRVSDQLPPWVMGDQHRFSQVLTNLIGNAIKYTDAGSIQINIEPSSKKEGHIYVEVKDTGMGINKNILPHIFERFTQAHNLPQISGTGLGLAICKSLIELMDGEVGVSSDEGKGSVFWFDILLPSAPDIHGVQDGLNDGSESLSFDGVKVLLAEDSEANQMIIQHMLMYLGCEVDIAQNGEVAVALYEQNSYDLVFMDCNMPVLDGYEATKKIRALYGKKTPVIAISAHAFAHNIQLCYDAGMNDYVHKPVKLESLRLAIEKWIPEDSKKMIKSGPVEIVLPETPINFSAFGEAFIHNTEKLNKLIDLTLKNSQELHDEILKAYSDGEYKELSEAAHALKSVSAQVGGDKLSNVCKSLEADALADIHPFMDEHIQVFKLEFRLFMNSLQNAKK